MGPLTTRPRRLMAAGAVAGVVLLGALVGPGWWQERQRQQDLEDLNQLQLELCLAGSDDADESFACLDEWSARR
jgi:hypothetical protein